MDPTRAIASGRVDGVTGRVPSDPAALRDRLERRIAELTILHDIGAALQAATDLDRIVYTVLVGATAHQGLSFQRAFVLLVDRASGTIEGRGALGPADAGEAARIWPALASDRSSLGDLLERVGREPPPQNHPLVRLVRSVRTSVEDGGVLALALRTRGVVVVRDGFASVGGVPVEVDLMERLGTDRFVIAPMVAENEPVGLLLADNAVAPRPFGAAEIELLDMLATQAAMAIDRATLITALRAQATALEAASREIHENQRRLLRSERLATLGEMAARVAHEFRTPLTVIGGFARSLVERSVPDTPDRDTLRIVADEVRRLEGIVSSVLDRAKEQGQDVRLVDVGRVASEAIEMLRYEFDGHRVRAALDVEDGSRRAWADGDRLFQALINLMHNAVQAMPDGGDLHVHVRTAGPAVEVEVRDEGVGIPDRDLRNVFEPFYTTRPDGTGLGLSIVARIARDHGGEVRIASEEGLGTSVVLAIPSARPEDDAPRRGG